MNKKKIILFSCRDPACGFNIRNFILNSDLLKKEVIDFKIICQEPCSYVFKNNSMIDNSKIRFIPIIKRKKTLLNEATSIIEEFYPDILICGISGSFFGIDEALLKICNQYNITSFGIQNSWGDFNKSFSSEPDIYLVLDKKAKEITKKNSSKKIKVIGSIKNESYTNKKFSKIKQQIREELNIKKKELVFGFFGQNINQKYYLNILRYYLNYYKKFFSSSYFFYKTHPKENNKAEKLIEDSFINNKDKLIIERGELCMEKCLVLCDVVASLFSSCIREHQYIIKLSKEPIGIPLFLMLDNNARKHYFQKTNLNEIPFSKNISLVIKKEDDFRFINSFSKISSMKKNIRDQILKNTYVKNSNSKKLLKYILNFDGERC